MAHDGRFVEFGFCGCILLLPFDVILVDGGGVLVYPLPSIALRATGGQKDGIMQMKMQDSSAQEKIDIYKT